MQESFVANPIGKVAYAACYEYAECIRHVLFGTYIESIRGTPIDFNLSLEASGLSLIYFINGTSDALIRLHRVKPAEADFFDNTRKVIPPGQSPVSSFVGWL